MNTIHDQQFDILNIYTQKDYKDEIRTLHFRSMIEKAKSFLSDSINQLKENYYTDTFNQNIISALSIIGYSHFYCE